MNIEQIARTAYEVKRIYGGSIGEFPRPSWEYVTKEVKKTEIDRVKFRLDNPDLTSRDIHGIWLNERIIEGWVYGKEIDQEAKAHPYLVSYEKLPVETRTKEALTMAVVKSFL
jgi:hypothetical protein